MAEEFDFIIVGAGSAGCVLANRLSENPENRVLLLEAGPKDSNPMFRVPLGYAYTLKSTRLNWQFPTVADPGTNNRVHTWPRGKALGGSSSINAMIYIRGNPGDYDGWAQMGCRGWGWADVLPYFMKSEDYGRGPQEGHGTGGPLPVDDPAWRHPMSETLLEAAAQAGIPRNEDFNTGQQEGAGYCQFTIRRGLRQSTARTFLQQAEGRPNLKVITGALAHQVLIRDRRAVGVRYGRGSRTEEARARREVVLSGGAINSPQLLELSGIGDAERLKSVGIEPVHHLPGVGENLQDHYSVGLSWRLKAGTPSVNSLARGLPLVGQLAAWLFRREGLMTVGPAHVTMFTKSRPDLAWPDLQFHATPASLDAEAYKKNELVFYDWPGLTLGACVIRPESIGHVHVVSPRPSDYPAITPNYLSTDYDRRATVEGMRQSRMIMDQPAIRGLVGSEFTPGADARSDDDLLAFARETGTTIYHPVGTARMGPSDDPSSVVDDQLRVIGIEGLRVADASIMPRLISGNTNAPAIMIGEKAADMLLGRSSPVAGALAGEAVGSAVS